MPEARNVVEIIGTDGRITGFKNIVSEGWKVFHMDLNRRGSFFEIMFIDTDGH